jgi:hypothetical protein
MADQSRARSWSLHLISSDLSSGFSLDYEQGFERGGIIDEPIRGSGKIARAACPVHLLGVLGPVVTCKAACTCSNVARLKDMEAWLQSTMPAEIRVFKIVSEVEQINFA